MKNYPRRNEFMPSYIHYCLGWTALGPRLRVGMQGRNKGVWTRGPWVLWGLMCLCKMKMPLDTLWLELNGGVRYDIDAFFSCCDVCIPWPRNREESDQCPSQGRRWRQVRTATDQVRYDNHRPRSLLWNHNALVNLIISHLDSISHVMCRFESTSLTCLG